MTVEQFGPGTSTSNSAQSQTITLDIPSKMIEGGIKLLSIQVQLKAQ